jgi:uncharacterized repeat protein (TIGR03803 family)
MKARNDFGFVRMCSVLIYISLVSSLVQGQPDQLKLFGATFGGSTFNGGGVYSVNLDGTNPTAVHAFGGPNPSGPLAGLIQASDGDFYGLTFNGGSYGWGMIYKIKPDGTGFTNLYDFDGTVPSTQYGYSKFGLIQGVSGELFGAVGNRIFKINTNGTGFSILFTFNGANGEGPRSLTQGADGTLFGTTGGGGTYASGIIYKIQPNGTGFSKLFDFDYNTGTGYNPDEGLLIASNGDLYGTTVLGGTGTPGAGVIFRIKTDGTGYTKIHDFDGVNGGYSLGKLMQASNGYIYGRTLGNNKIFRIKVDGSDFSIIFEANTSTGTGLGAKLIQGPDNNLYGTLTSGGANLVGVIFRINLDGTGFTKLIDCSEANGRNPQGLILAADGDWYGIGATRIFKIKTDGSGYLALYTFYGSTYEKDPSRLIQASNGNLYGACQQGGVHEKGAVYKIKANGTGYTILFEFDGINGSGPANYSSLTQASNGVLYGTTQQGGVNNVGVIYKINLDGTGFTKLYDFGGIDGSSPIGLVQGINGDLYGITRYGGTSGSGTIFKMQAGGTGFVKLFDFDASSGMRPKAKLILGSNGDLFGTNTAGGGGANWGVIFRIKQDGTDFTKIYNFVASNGDSQAEMIQGINGELFGMTFGGGANNSGIIYKINEDGSGFTSLHDFDGINGGSPYGPLIQNTNGNGALYGTTLIGGANNRGTIFKINPDGTGFTKLLDMSAATGLFPLAGGVTLVSVNKGVQTITFPAIPAKEFNNPPFTLNATSSSGLPVSYSSSNTAVATVLGNTVTIVGVGTSMFTATQSGNVDYNDATPVAQTLTVNKAAQTITFAALADKTLGDAAITLTATASSGLAVSFSTANDKVTLAGNVATLAKAGRATITAAQAGNTNYNAATSVNQSFCIKPAKPTVTVTNIDTESPILTSSAATGNQWFLNDVAIAGATNATFNITAAGVYKVQVKVDDCTSEFSADLPLIVTGDLKNQTKGESIEVYPNPVADWLTVSLGSYAGKKGVAIYELNGKQTDGKEVEGSEARFNVEGYAQGMYMVKVQTQSSVRVIRFVKK